MPATGTTELLPATFSHHHLRWLSHLQGFQFFCPVSREPHALAFNRFRPARIQNKILPRFRLSSPPCSSSPACSSAVNSPRITPGWFTSPLGVCLCAIAARAQSHSPPPQNHRPSPFAAAIFVGPHPARRHRPCPTGPTATTPKVHRLRQTRNTTPADCAYGEDNRLYTLLNGASPRTYIGRVRRPHGPAEKSPSHRSCLSAPATSPPSPTASLVTGSRPSARARHPKKTGLMGTKHRPLGLARHPTITPWKFTGAAAPIRIPIPDPDAFPFTSPSRARSPRPDM